MTWCKQMRESVENYSLYIHGFLIPEIQKQREEGKLSKGKFISILTFQKAKKRSKVLMDTSGSTKESQIRKEQLVEQVQQCANKITWSTKGTSTTIPLKGTVSVAKILTLAKVPIIGMMKRDGKENTKTDSSMGKGQKYAKSK